MSNRAERRRQERANQKPVYITAETLERHLETADPEVANDIREMIRKLAIKGESFSRIITTPEVARKLGVK